MAKDYRLPCDLFGHVTEVSIDGWPAQYPTLTDDRHVYMQGNWMRAYAGKLSSGPCMFDTPNDVLILLPPRNPPRPVQVTTEKTFKDECSKHEIWSLTKRYLLLLVVGETLIGQLRSCQTGKSLYDEDSDATMSEYGFLKHGGTWRAETMKVLTSYSHPETGLCYAVISTTTDRLCEYGDGVARA